SSESLYPRGPQTRDGPTKETRRWRAAPSFSCRSRVPGTPFSPRRKDWQNQNGIFLGPHSQERRFPLIAHSPLPRLFEKVPVNEIAYKKRPRCSPRSRLGLSTRSR